MRVLALLIEFKREKRGEGAVKKNKTMGVIIIMIH